MYNPEKIRRYLTDITLVLAAIFIINACATTDTVTHYLCQDGDGDSLCLSESDIPFAGVPAIIIYADGHTEPTFTDEEGAVSYSLNNGQSGVNLDLNSLRSNWDLCVFQYNKSRDGNIHITPIKLCGTSDINIILPNIMPNSSY